MPPRKNQASMFDRAIKDSELESLLGEVVKLEPTAKAFRSAKKSVRKRIEEKHPELAASVEDANGSGWVLCGGYRFRPRAVKREEGEVKIGAGTNWSCPVEAI